VTSVSSVACVPTGLRDEGHLHVGIGGALSARLAGLRVHRGRVRRAVAVGDLDLRRDRSSRIGPTRILIATL